MHLISMPDRLLFVNPSIRESSEPKHVPYGILLTAACAEEWFGAETALLDLNAMRSVLRPHEVDKEIVAAVQEEDWSCIGVGGITTTYSSIKHALKIIRPLTDTLIILGGGGFTAQPQEWMQLLPEVDVGVFGEAVQTIGDVLKHSHDMDFHDVPGVFYRDSYGRVAATKERPMIADMDVLPLPKYDLAPLDIYFKNSSILLSEESMTAKRRLDYAASIGCFPAQTLITTPEGEVPIEELHVTDQVTAFDSGRLTFRNAMVRSNMTRRAQTRNLRFSDGTALTTTNEHPIFTKRGWRMASRLQVGDDVLCQ